MSNIALHPCIKKKKKLYITDKLKKYRYLYMFYIYIQYTFLILWNMSQKLRLVQLYNAGH